MTFRRVLVSEKANFHCYMIAVFAILESVKSQMHSLWFYIPRLLALLFLTTTRRESLAHVFWASRQLHVFR